MPWCKEKNDFLILDCWDNFEYFKLNPRGKQLLPQVPLPVRLFGLRVEKIEQALILGKPEIAEKESSKAKIKLRVCPPILWWCWMPGMNSSHWKIQISGSI